MEFEAFKSDQSGYVKREELTAVQAELIKAGEERDNERKMLAAYKSHVGRTLEADALKSRTIANQQETVVRQSGLIASLEGRLMVAKNQLGVQKDKV